MLYLVIDVFSNCVLTPQGTWYRFFDKTWSKNSY